MGAKDLLGTNALSTNKELIMGIGAANRFKSGGVTSANRSNRRNLKPSFSKTETMSPHTYDNVLDEQRDNLESRLDWNAGKPSAKVSHSYQIKQPGFMHGGGRTRSRAQIRQEKKEQENLKMENGIIYKKENGEEMQR